MLGWGSVRGGEECRWGQGSSPTLAHSRSSGFDFKSLKKHVIPRMQFLTLFQRSPPWDFVALGRKREIVILPTADSSGNLLIETKCFLYALFFFFFHWKKENQSPNKCYWRKVAKRGAEADGPFYFLSHLSSVPIFLLKNTSQVVFWCLSLHIHQVTRPF